MLGLNVLITPIGMSDYDYPNYQIPESILEWGNAAHGDIIQRSRFLHCTLL